MADSSSSNNNFNLQQLVDKIKALVTPEKRAQMMTKIKAAWAVINEKPAGSEAKPVIQEKKSEELEKK